MKSLLSHLFVVVLFLNCSFVKFRELMKRFSLVFILSTSNRSFELLLLVSM